MAETVHDTTTAEVHHSADAGHGDVNLFKPDGILLGLTWVTFLLMTIVLYKVAWKPILGALEKREEDIRKSLEDAQKTREELARIEETRQRMVAEADAQARSIVEAARGAATEAAGVIERKAREEAQILVENAQREIRTEHAKAIASLRKESADLAIGLSKKILGENLDEQRSRDLVDRIIQKL